MADIGEMYLVHTMLRREFSLLPDLIRSADRNDAKRRAFIGAHAQLVCQILHAHHEGEDLVLWPLLLARAVAVATEIVAVMGEQHQAIAAAHDEAVYRLGAWCRCGYDGEGLATVVGDLVRVLTEHTALEEKAVLPLAEKYITAAEWVQMGQHGMDTFEKRLLPLAFGMLMYEGDPAVVRRTLSNVPQPARLLMPIIAPRAFSRHARRVYGTSTPPKITSNTFSRTGRGRGDADRGRHG
jgi:branched-subunit amino acid transport protein